MTHSIEAMMRKAYRERNELVALFAANYGSGVKPDPERSGFSIVYIDSPAGQLSWHFTGEDADLFADLPPYLGEWDGHSREEKSLRLLTLAKGATR
jgi:hypothetical protein